MTHANKAAIAVAVMAAGVLVISAADAVGRVGTAGTAHSAADAGYWLGEALIFAAPTALVLGRPEPGESQAAWLAVALATATYLVKYLYSPAAFEFPDEFLHWRTLTTLLTSHHLFGVNYALPVSPDFPGIEVVTSALIDLTGLGVFAAGLIVAGLAHLVFTTALYTLFRLVGGTARIGLAAVTIYATSPHYQVFDAIFGYQTLALAFFALALLALRAATRPNTSQHSASRTPAITAWVLAAVFGAVTAATHHVTSYVLVATAALIAVTGLAVRQENTGPQENTNHQEITGPQESTGPGASTDVRPRARGSRGVWGIVSSGEFCFAAGCAALIALWTWRVAPGTVSYLSPAVSQLADGVRTALTGHLTKAGGGTPLPAPIGDQVASDLVALLIMVAIPFGWRQIWRTRRGDAWALALGAGAAAYYPSVALPFITADGSELAGRLLTFVYIPVGYTLAVALVNRPITLRRNAAAAGAAVILVAGGIAMGWPPWWERLPGGFVVDGFESGITAEGLAAANWAGATLPPGQRVAADYTNNLLFGTLGGQNPVNGMAVLFCSGTWTVADAVLARQSAVKYLVVDLRTSVDRAADGSLFVGTASCPTPIPPADLSKFDAIPGMTRVYDSGNVIVYALSEAAYVP
jgi:hypothetical protein